MGIMYFLYIALSNSWVLYRRDKLTSDTPRKTISSFLKFRTIVAKAYMLRHAIADVLIRDENNDTME